MTDEIFVPQSHYRDLYFGMSPDEVNKLLGEPIASRNLWEEFKYSDDELPFIENCVAKQYRDYGPYHDVLDVEFHLGKVVAIHIQDAKQPITFCGINLFSKQRRSVIDELSNLDKDLYGHRESGFWGELGIISTWPSVWKQHAYIKLVDSEYIFDRLDFNNFDQLDAPLR
ncbi:hypothetical protein [Halocynthiibacter namhaensis]|uniref:hypothetical protein n=1 Tax=Halocynthiibacter namhaensis TaxID=1290553 RepID=UPI0005798C56|nr:hypothetical protein [Halocynthiibacter namhaensis]